MKDIFKNFEEKSIKITFEEISKLSRLKGVLIPLINSGNIELEEHISVIDELIKRYQEVKNTAQIKK